MILTSGCAQKDKALVVYLRCAPGISGSLSLVLSPPDQGQALTHKGDVQALCRAGQVRLAAYQRKQHLTTLWTRADGEPVEIRSVYGDDIQSDEKAFYLIIKLTDSSPFLVNDRI